MVVLGLVAAGGVSGGLDAVGGCDEERLRGGDHGFVSVLSEVRILDTSRLREVPALRLQEALDARLQDHIGGRDGRDSILPIMRDSASLRDVVSQPQLSSQEALDGAPPDANGRQQVGVRLGSHCDQQVQARDLVALDGRDTALHLLALRDSRARVTALRAEMADDVALILARQAADQAAAERARALRISAVSGDAQSALPQEPQAEGVGDGLRRITHYLCKNPWGDGGYCFWMGCHGQQVGAGFAACPSWRCDQRFQLADYTFTCGDTGSWPIENDEVIDIACYGDDDGDAFFHWGSPGTAEYEISCPTFSEYEAIRWLTP